jgi:YbbR domain-containing protein
MAARDYILNNFSWKLLSLLLAALTWLAINTAFKKEESLQRSPVVSTNKRSFLDVPVTLLTASSNTNRFRTTPQTVAVEVGGTAIELPMLQAKDIQAFVDVTDAGDEKQFRKVIQIQLPREYSVVSVNPTNASVERITSSIK